MREQLYQFLKEQEGEKLNAYICPAGKVTIGVGVTGKYQDGETIKMGDNITRQQSKDLFFWFVDNNVLPLIPKSLNTNQTIALASFIFNIGSASWQNSTLRRLVTANKNNPAIKEEFLKWIYYTNPKTGKKEVLPALKMRREREAKLYFS